MYWSPNAQLISKASIGTYLCIGFLSCILAGLCLEGCFTGDGAAKSTTTTTTTTAPINTTTTTRITNTSERTTLSSGSAQSSTTNATPIFAMRSQASFSNHKQAPHYKFGSTGLLTCPPSFFNVFSQSECQDAAAYLGLIDCGLVDQPGRPGGCFTNIGYNNACFNTNAGSAYERSSPICKKAYKGAFRKGDGLFNISVDELLNISSEETLNISLETVSRGSELLSTTTNEPSPEEDGLIERFNRFYRLCKKNLYIVVPAAILCLCGVLALGWCCCCRRSGRKAKKETPRKESDEGSRMLQENGSSQIEVYDIRDPSDVEDVLNPEDSSHPYEFQFTRYAIESMIPDMVDEDELDEDEPDLS